MAADTKEKKISGKPEKFLFDMNCFDDGYVEEVIPEVPPPPVFSEQELEDARKAAYDKGRRDAAAEALASREKQIADLIGAINKKFETLFAAEADREKRYETEAVLAARAIFEKLFPALNARHGLDEVMAVIITALEGRRDHAEIVIDTAPDFREAAEQRLAPVIESLRGRARVTVSGNDGLKPGDCRMTWKDGGAQRDIGALAGEIGRALEHLLADRPSLQDNGDRHTAGSGIRKNGDAP